MIIRSGPYSTTGTNPFTLTGPIARIVGGATSTSIRNNANTVDNLLILDSGATTLTGQAGVGSGVAGASHAIFTGNSGSGTASGGDLTIHLGSGTSPNTQSTIGHQGNLKIITQDLGYGLGTNIVTINAYGVGIGTNTSALQYVPLQVVFTYVDATLEVAGSQHILTMSQTADSAVFWDSMTTGVFTGTDAFNVTGGIQAQNNETWIRKTGGTISTILNITSEILPQVGSAANFTTVEAFAGRFDNHGTGTATLVRMYESNIQISATNGAADSNITTGYGYSAMVSNFSTAGTPGVLGTYIGFYAEQSGYASAGTITNYTGFKVATMRNSFGASSTAGGFQTIGLDISLGNQSNNTSGTNTNIGIQITGNGGTAGGGGTVTNWAILSNSTAPSSFAGLISTKASASAGAGLRLPHGAAPSAPSDGDMWTTSSGLFVRINGVTVGPLS